MKPMLKIKLELEEPSGIQRSNWPVSRGIPFKEGTLKDPSLVVLLDQNNEPLPIQTRILSSWPDGSIKWLWIHFQATLESQAKVEYQLIVDNHRSQPTITTKQILQNQGPIYSFDTGPLQISIDTTQGFSVAEQATLNQWAMLTKNGSRGFVLTDAHGRQFSSADGKITQVEIEANGPLRAVLHIKGDHRDTDGQKLFRYEARLTAFAGHPWLELEYTFINDSDPDFIDLKQVGFEIYPVLPGKTSGLVGAYTLLHEDSEPFSIYQDKPCRYFFFSGTRIYDTNDQHVEYEYAGEMLRKAAHGWMDISSEEGGITVSVKRLAMMAPKAIEFTGHSINVQFWPERAGLLHFHQGMARTHRVMLNFHSGTGRDQNVNQLATCFEDDLLVTVPDWIIDSGVWGDVFPYHPKEYPEINIRLRDQFNNYYMGNMDLGFFDYGDSLQHAGGDRKKYTANNEYDMPQVMALMFARTGEREYYEVMEASAWHMMDIDFIHHTTHAPLELGGVRIHGNGHVQYNCEGMPDFSLATSHMWTEGLLSYYCLTGHPAALEKAVSIGNCLLKLLAHGWALSPYKVEWHSVRDSAWPIIALSALFAVTGEEKWLNACKLIGENVIESQHPDGSWDLYLGWYQGSFTPLQIGIGLNGLARYHSLTADPRAKNALIKGARCMIDNCRYPEGVLCYINAPGYRWNYYATCIIEALGYIWNLSGDKDILEIGERSLYRALSTTTGNGTVIAESWRGMLRYMYWAEKAGTLKDIRPWVK